MLDEPKKTPIDPLATEVFAGVGICVKDADFRVLEQNSVCHEICGNELGNICKKGCAEHRSSQRDQLTTAPFVQVANSFIECVLIEEDARVTTLQFPNSTENKNLLSQLNQLGLTKTEMKVAIYKLQGRSNKEIADHMCISGSTLKTHLNHLFHKAPENIIQRLKGKL